MATTLDVVNDCLATLGETPLNTLLEPHEFKSAAQRQLAKENRAIQSRGFWFNTEAMTLTPAPTTGHCQLGGDIIKWESGVRARDTLVMNEPKPWIVQRGTRLYDTRNRTYSIDEPASGHVVRLVPFEDLPPVVNDYVAAQAVLKFQSNFDADNSRRQELVEAWKVAKIQFESEHIRQTSVNSINNNDRLMRIKSKVARLRNAR